MEDIYKSGLLLLSTLLTVVTISLNYVRNVQAREEGQRRQVEGCWCSQATAANFPNSRDVRKLLKYSQLKFPSISSQAARQVASKVLSINGIIKQNLTICNSPVGCKTWRSLARC